MSKALFPALFKPVQLGDLQLKNRIIMASMTRNRNIYPTEMNAEYYAQRAGAGLVLSEGTLIEPQGTEWPEAPGIWNSKQIEGWKKVTKAVHNAGGLIWAQLWHLGRAAHVLHNCGVPPPAPSAIAANGGKFRLLNGTPGYSVPEAIEDPQDYVKLYIQAAENAKAAGFDGVELHAANGYLVTQFLEQHSNKRTDNYGGSIENRIRFALEIIDGFIKIWGASRVGIKLSPSGGYNDMGEKYDDAVALYSQLIKELDSRKLGYIQVMRHFQFFDPTGRGTPINIDEVFRPLIKNSLFIVNGDFSPEEGEKWVEEGKADAVAFARPYISNPDFVERLQHGKELSAITDMRTLYLAVDNDKSKGYTDYPRAT
ncbi:FMN-linked oxidoreductase [Basidiobolus meristosporus CBS 931.73]|uniref:FMN-linked oxidoreductase n=1 Tax=Basidiobolus meristosporus CBS 931.73 TaxID=1314790 RepID=A0A1Y1Y9I6_9FUNG|nr:FMN-linked oxidoreductase [Basidiobolus meristosporus CBS 931.73]|eukprot:ORX94234.1 FMN-linked oxidoreductase [Basidiobolus meristosporus CBS 931.73]